MTTTASSDSSRAGRLEPIAAPIGRIQERIAQIRRRNALQRAEFGVDCLDCRDAGKSPLGFCHCPTGQVLAEQAEADARAVRERSFREGLDEALQIPARFQGLTWDSFPAQSALILVQIQSWLESRDERRGLILTGPFGVGKTALMIDLLRRLVIRREEASGYETQPGRLGCFMTATGLLQSLRPRDGVRESDDARLARYQRVRYLAIDDLGAERLTAWGADRLFEIVNERHNELRPLLITSNLSPSALASRWNAQAGDGEAGDRIVNRLIESCDVLAFGEDAPNWRLRKGA